MEGADLTSSIEGCTMMDIRFRTGGLVEEEERMLEPGTSAAEKMLGGLHFVSDPRLSKFDIPVPPGEDAAATYTFNRFVVTPDVARDWAMYRVIVPSVTPRELKHAEFEPNRRIQPHRIRHWDRVFTGTARDGETWNPDTPPGIVISWDGFILDGQHRIAGSLISRTAFEVPLVVNCDWSVLPTMDTPLRRNAGQMTDVPHPQAAATIARYLLPAIYGTETREYTMRRNMREVIGITRSYPWFRNHHWIGEIKKLGKYGFPATPLGSVVFGALAAGANEFEVQGFLNGLHPYTRNEWNGAGNDPRRLLGQRYVGKLRGRSEAEMRSDAGIFRKAMTVWLNRHQDNPDVIERFNPIGTRGNLPPFWNSDKIREFHAATVKEV